jgi:hypothetical protein
MRSRSACACCCCAISSREENGLYRANPREEILLRYYANSIAHLPQDATPAVAAA